MRTGSLTSDTDSTKLLTHKDSAERPLLDAAGTLGLGHPEGAQLLWCLRRALDAYEKRLGSCDCPQPHLGKAGSPEGLRLRKEVVLEKLGSARD